MATKHKSGSKLLKTRSLSRSVMAVVAILAVSAGYVLVHKSFAASGVMTLVVGSTGPVSVGNNVTVSVKVNGGTDALNTVEADLTYPTALLQFVSIDSTGTAFPVTAQATGGNGTVTIAAGTQGGATPITGDAQVATITFKAIGLGSATLGLSNSSVGLRASDSTNVINIRNGATLTVADITAPTAPTGLMKTSSTLSSVTLGWTASSDNVGVTGYRIYRDAAGTQVGTVSNAATSFTDSGLNPGTSYTYSIAAIDAAGNVSARSGAAALSTLADTSAPTTPVTVQASTRNLTSLTLSWVASTDDVGVTGYTIFRNSSQIGSVAAVGYTDTGLTPGTSYSYTVTSHDAVGNTSALSSAVSVATLPDTIAPSVPTSLTSGAQSGGNIALNWTASTDNVGVTQYRIYRNGTQVGTYVVGSGTTTGGSYPLPTTPGSYVFTVAAVDAAGNVSTPSSPVTINTFGPADINKDGKINITDLSMLLSAWGKTGANVSDINGDGAVSIIDLSLLLAAWTG